MAHPYYYYHYSRPTRRRTHTTSYSLGFAMMLGLISLCRLLDGMLIGIIRLVF